MEKKNQQPKIAFRYQEEIMTLYNKGVKKFLKVIWFVSLVGTIGYVMTNRSAFVKDIWITLLAFAILIAFSGFLWYRTKKFGQKVREFVTQGKKTKGTIVETKLRMEDRKPCLEVAYRDPTTGQDKHFMTEPVTGDPSMLLKSPEVDVYVLGERAFATNFRVVLGDEKPYGKKRK